MNNSNLLRFLSCHVTHFCRCDDKHSGPIQIWWSISQSVLLNSSIDRGSDWCEVRLGDVQRNSHFPPNALQPMAWLMREDESDEGRSMQFSPAIHRSDIDPFLHQCLRCFSPVLNSKHKNQPPAGTPTGKPASSSIKRSRLAWSSQVNSRQSSSEFSSAACAAF
jgi:hypothetical protein